MQTFPMFGRRWVRWSGVVFLATWLPTAGVLAADYRAWASGRHLNRWAGEMVTPTFWLVGVALVLGVIINDLLIVTGRAREVSKPDPQAADYDDKPPPAG